MEKSGFWNYISYILKRIIMYGYSRIGVHARFYLFRFDYALRSSSNSSSGVDGRRLGNEDDDEWSIGVRQLVGNYNDILYYISVRI